MVSKWSNSLYVEVVLLLLFFVGNLGVVGCSSLENYPSSESCFKSTFDKDPSSTITNLRAEGKGGADWDNIYLQFNASPTEFKSLLGNRFTPITRAEFDKTVEEYNFNTGTPSWWQPLSGSPRLFFRGTSFKSSNALVTYNPETGLVYFHWRGTI